MDSDGNLLAIDLFSGAGGMSLGFELARNIRVVAAVENCPKAMRTHEWNFPDCESFNDDITELDPQLVEKRLQDKERIKVADIDLIIGGPPCPGFSNIGRSKIISLLREGKISWAGRPPKEFKHQFIQDPRNKLFLHFIKFVEHFKPNGFVMENVPGMRSSKNSSGKAIDSLVIDSFKDIGYECRSKILHANDFGVPQTRQRLIFIGWPEGRKGKKNIFEFPSRDSPYDDPVTSIQAISDLSSGGEREVYWEGGPFPTKTSPATNPFQKKMRYEEYQDAKRKDQRLGCVPSSRKQSKINSHTGRRVNERDRGIFPMMEVKPGSRNNYGDLHPEKCNYPDGWDWDPKKERVTNGEKEYKWYNQSSFKDKIRRISQYKPSPTLVAHMGVDTYMYIHPLLHRTITPREAARIQSFPDAFDFPEDVSFVSKYKQIGNAVPPLMAKAIAKEIKIAWGIL